MKVGYKDIKGILEINVIEESFDDET